jgi:Holliday junction resolvase RusA-like endonuclease
MIRFVVIGTPAPKGSMRAILIRGRPRLIASGSSPNEKALRVWRKAILDRVDAAFGKLNAPVFVEQPLEVHLVFRLPRPRDHFGTGRNAGVLKASAPIAPMAQRDDVDKLARATLDALVDARVIDDDGRIAILIAQKEWESASSPPGATIDVRAMTRAEAQQSFAIAGEVLAKQKEHSDEW